ncbi:MAG: GAF domain-containing protein [Mycobacteriales bacterium]
MSAEDEFTLRRHAARADALIEVTRSLAGFGTDLDGLALLVLDRVANLVGDAVTVWTLPVGAQDVVAAGSTHIDAQARRMLEDIQRNAGPQSADGITRAVIDTGEPLVIYDFAYEDYVERIHRTYRPWMKQYGASSLAVLPMRARGRVLGAIGATRDRGRPQYTAFEIDFMQAIADIAGVAFDNARMLVSSDDEPPVL